MRDVYKKIKEVLNQTEYAYLVAENHTNWVFARLEANYEDWENLGAKDFAAAVIDCAEECDNADAEQNISMVRGYIG